MCHYNLFFYYIPLSWGDAIPSIHWKIADNYGPTLCAIPDRLITKCISSYGFSSDSKHIRYRITSSFFALGTDRRYIAYWYYKLTNISVNNFDTRIVLNRGLTYADNKSDGICLKCKYDSSLIESIRSNQMVKIFAPLKKRYGFVYHQNVQSW